MRSQKLFIRQAMTIAPSCAAKNAVGHEVGMLGAARLRVLPGEKSQLCKVAEHADQPIEQADIDQTAAAGPAALVQRGQNAHGAVDPAHQVAQGNPELRGGATLFAVDAQGAGQSL
jgi:hypothetical protein